MGWALWCFSFVIINSIVLFSCTNSWSDRQLFPASQIPDNALSPHRAVVRKKIVLYHNFFRTKVKPAASNMLMMSWHQGAAKQAQAYAEQCRYLTHNDYRENTVPHLGTCGQNLFVASQKTPWFFAIKNWFLEYRNFTYGAPIENLKIVGHYTQMVWATSHKLGCGMAHCAGGPWGHFYNYVCHYCPGGNFDTITQYPYKVGPPCDDCPDHCVAGLCSNACAERDYFYNCGELVQHSRAAVCRQHACNATCTCTHQIHRNYPWK